LAFSTKAQQTYEAATIPKELLAYASAVIRNSEISIEVNGLDNTVYHYKTAITVLNKNGDESARIVAFYGKGQSIKNIKGAVYDEFGKLISKITQSNFSDESAVHDFSLFEDTRVKHYLPPVTQYPYTVVCEYDIKSDQSLYFRDWVPNSSTATAVENSTYTFICKPDFNIRYKEFNITSKAVVATNNAGLKTYTWKISNLKAIKPEPFSPNNESFLPRVKIAPEKFEYEDVKGSFTNWQELGKWNYDKLLANRQYVTDETAEHIKQLVADITDPKLKAKKIYEYMQGKTHYISVQVGIGGYQPFKAIDVDKLGYGDCKGLVNYTQSLLKLVNIDSYYCVVTAGDRKVSMEKDFASMNQGNHIILCIPFKNDTTWLECTSQTIPFGYLGDFTDDRIVLACTPQGGKLMHTPKYDAAVNLQSRKANFSIASNGELSADMTTVFKGIEYEKREGLIDESPVEQNKSIQRIYNINNLILQKLAIKQDKAELPVTTEDIKFSAAYYGAEDNGKIHFALNPLDRIGAPPKEVRNRMNDVYINDGYTNEDEIAFTLPEGYHPSRLAMNVSINKPFGKYTATTAMKDGKLIYKRTLQVIDGTYSKEMYQDLIDFYEKVDQNDRLLITLTKGAN